MAKQNKPDMVNRAMIISAVLIFILAGVVLISGLVRNDNNTPSQMMTLPPDVVDQMTALPQATPLSEEAEQDVLEFLAKVETCTDFSPERLSQMRQHIRWLIVPAEIPADIIPAFGANPAAKLIFGMAGYTASEWRLLGRPADSCLVPIGLELNKMLIEVGEQPFEIYVETPTN